MDFAVSPITFRPTRFISQPIRPQSFKATPKFLRNDASCDSFVSRTPAEKAESEESDINTSREALLHNVIRNIKELLPLLSPIETLQVLGILKKKDNTNKENEGQDNLRYVA